LGKVKKISFLPDIIRAPCFMKYYISLYQEKDTVLIIIILSFRGGRTAWTMLQWWYYNVII